MFVLSSLQFYVCILLLDHVFFHHVSPLREPVFSYPSAQLFCVRKLFLSICLSAPVLYCPQYYFRSLIDYRLKKDVSLCILFFSYSSTYSISSTLNVFYLFVLSSDVNSNLTGFSVYIFLVHSLDTPKKLNYLV